MLFFDTKTAHRDPRLASLEPAILFSLIMLYIWWLRAGHSHAVFVLFGLVLISHYWHGESPGELGFRATNFRVCFQVFAPALLFIALLLLSAGILLQTLREVDLERAAVGFIAYCVWGLFQQYVLNAYFVNRLLPGASSPTQAAAMGATCFAGAHAPNWFLMIVGFLSAYCCARIWIRYRNLYFLGIAHGAIGSMLYLVVPDAITHHMVVGPRWFSY